MPIFEDVQPSVFCVPEQDAVVCVIERSYKVSQTAKTGGSIQCEMQLEVEGKNTWCYETLTVHPSCMWRVDSFLKCMGLAPEKGKGWSFYKDEAEREGWKWVDPLGCRGHVHLMVEPKDPPGPNQKNKNDRNRVGVYYCNKGQLPRRQIEQSVDEDIPF